ncbi:MAG TPA: nucleotidyltransferase substrate binding protein [Candidatus Hydrogenedentes bacterium]|nr:nucleotidyltransferase substrate binding protein [Candidatus Hydrogenedentota bacterium]
MSAQDIRWIQRLNNFSKALHQLQKFMEKSTLNDLEKQGLIQAFEYNYELAWNTIKDYFEDQGETNINGSRDAFRMAFKRGLIEEGEVWMDMIKSRMLTTHTYNEGVAKQMVTAITTQYFFEFSKLHAKLLLLKEKTK